MHLLQVVPMLLAVTQAGRLGTAGQPFGAYSAVEGWLTGFAVAALIISLILLFYLSVNHKRSLDNFKHQITGLKVHIEELQRRIADLEQQTPVKVSEQVSPEESEKLVAIQKS